MNPFAEKYKTLSIAQLLDIIDTPVNYQAAAIAAAEDELICRNISVAEMAEARYENEVHNAEKAAKSEKKRALEDKFVNAANSVIEAVHPVQKAPVSLNRVILLISIVFGIIGAVRLYYFAKYLPISLNAHYHLPISTIMPYFFQGFYLLGAAFLFWKQMKWGWIFLGIYITYSALGAIFLTLVELWRSGMLPRVSGRYYPDYTPSLLFNLLFYGCCIWFISKGNIRRLYTVNRPLAIIVGATGAFLALLIFVLALRRF